MHSPFAPTASSSGGLFGIATGVAALGSILATQVSDSVVSKLARTPLASGSHQLVSAISNGSILQAMHAVPASQRAIAAAAAKSSFIDGLNSILLTSAKWPNGGHLKGSARIRAQKTCIPSQSPRSPLTVAYGHAPHD